MKIINIKIVFLFAAFLLFSYVAIMQTNSSKKVAGLSTNDESAIKGVIIPHHDLAKELIFQTLDKLQQNSYDQIIVFGVNHFYPESYMTTTSYEIENYPINKELVDSLMEILPRTVISKEIMENEHSATLPMKYLLQYFPDAKYLSFIFSPFFNQEDLDKLSDLLAQEDQGKTLYVAAVDFAHDVSLPVGLEKNEESIKTISKFDYPTLYTYGNDHLDSTVAITALLKTMEKIQSTNWETWISSHASLLLDNPSLQGTSYVIGVFY